MAIRQRLLTYRLALLASIVLIVPLGYSIRLAQGPGPAWLHDALGGFAYEIFLILLVLFLAPKLPPLRVAIAVCLITCLMEVLQLWQNPVYKAMQATFIGRIVLGNTFTWSDFPNYFVGSALGWLWARSLQQTCVNPPSP